MSGFCYCFGEGLCQTHLDDFPIKDKLFCQVIKKAKVVWKLCEWYETTGSKYSEETMQCGVQENFNFQTNAISLYIVYKSYYKL